MRSWEFARQIGGSRKYKESTKCIQSWLPRTTPKEQPGRSNSRPILAKRANAELTVISVMTGLGEDLGAFANVEEQEAMPEAFDTKCRQILARAREQARQAGANPLALHWGWGDPTEVIMQTAAQLKADVVIVGRRGRGRLAGLLLGSVSLSQILAATRQQWLNHRIPARCFAIVVSF
ncbi:universal stress protein [Hyphomicrobium sp. DY-1]|uniref:universal stress protein n=1 Tax=Hyphomicrobium sp. DY-1 TaxID=3075650 RepID=UPI0039C2F4C9